MSLTEAAIFFRKFFKVALMALLALLILWLSWGFLVAGFRIFFPAEETPTLLFGKIPSPKLPANPSGAISFTLDTPSEEFPALPKVMPVYQFISPEPNLLDSDRANKLAADFGFGNPQQIDQQTFRYTDSSHPTEEMRINIVSKNFSIINSNFADPTILKTPPEGTTEEIISSARNMLDLRNILWSDLTGSKASVRFLKLSGTSATAAGSIAESNFARIDLFRSDIKNYPLVTPTYHDALIYLTISGGRSDQTKIVEGSYIYWPYDANPNSTYPLRSIASAWEELRSGQGSLISPLNPNFSGAKINGISLAYFEGAEYQPYLQPIYLFTGVGIAQDGSEVKVILYLPAVDPGYFSE